MPIFKGCVECSGARKRPRNGDGGATCSAAQCKKAYKQRRSAPQTAQDSEDPASLDTIQRSAGDMLPAGKWVHEIEEILGERCCEPSQLTYKQRKNGPGSAYVQQYLVRGTFLEEDGDDDDDDDETPEPNTYWVLAVDLSETILARDIKVALRQRFERVIGDV